MSESVEKTFAWFIDRGNGTMEWSVEYPDHMEGIDWLAVAKKGRAVPVAFVVGELMDPDVDSHAAMIAAAPEMLEALRYADEWLSELGCDCGVDEPNECAFCRTRAAIAKAEGRETWSKD